MFSDCTSTKDPELRKGCATCQIIKAASVHKKASASPLASSLDAMRCLLTLLSFVGMSFAFRSLNLERIRPKAIRNKNNELFLPTTTPGRSFALHSGGESVDESKKPKKSSKGQSSTKANSSKRKKNSKSPKIPKDTEPTAQTKEELVRAVGEKMRSKNGGVEQGKTAEESNLFDKINPFKVGQNLRQTIDTLTSIALRPEPHRSIYYIDDRISELGGGARYTSRDSLFERLEQDDYIPEVLVVGATGEVGRLVVRRLLLDGRFRVRVLVRDLYSKTLNLLGTGVTYCQGDLHDLDSLSYALTDADKIVFCATAPRPDEDQFQQKFEDFMKEQGLQADGNVLPCVTESEKTHSDREWEQLESVLELRARLAEQVDCVGMQNLVRAYQDVRHTDYGTSQAAKRSLFKFQDRPEDFNLFAIDQDDDDDDDFADARASNSEGAQDSADLYADYDDEEDPDNYDDTQYDRYGDEYSEYDDEYAETLIESRRETSVKTQVQWIRNKFEHGVFVGRIPTAIEGSVGGGEAAIASSRLRSRDNPDSGIDLGTEFAGFVCRVCSDGGSYEAFVRTGAYYEDGVEYVCEFSTSTKPTGNNKSRNRFTTIRLPFESFKPIRRKAAGGADDTDSISAFRGRDVRNIGFRYRSASNPVNPKREKVALSSFYLAFCYIKLYRSQPESEFVYLSDARIPPVVHHPMVRHGLRQLTAETDDALSSGSSFQLLDESALEAATQAKTGRSQEETYYKYRGEEILKKSGLSYTIVRVSEFNESPSGEASTIDLVSSNANVQPVSRAEVAQVCVSALLDPHALNKSLYISKKSGQSTRKDEDISFKFSALPADTIV